MDTVQPRNKEVLLELSISPRKVLRTGEVVVAKDTNQRGIVQHIETTYGDRVFEEEVQYIKSVHFDDGKEIDLVPITLIDLVRR